jgi:glucose/mannose-6-phosphate isomerase
VSALDDADELGRRDPGGALQQVAGLPGQLEHVRQVQAELAQAAPDLAARVRVRGAGVEVVVCGMGGSAIGGDYAAAWGARHGLRIGVHRGYGLPRWVTARHLLVFCSYSGDTEEVLSAFAAADGDALRACITTGGELGERARGAGVPLVLLPPGLQPRAAIGHALVALLALLHAAGLVAADPAAEIEAAARHLQAYARTLAPAVPEAANRAKQLARACHEHLPWVCTGSGFLRPVGRRWKTQIHENAKSPAVHSVLPEMNHNEILAWSAGVDAGRSACMLFLPDPDDPAAVERRMRLTAEILRPHLARIEWVHPESAPPLARMLASTLLGDYASVYLAFLNGVDPTPVPEIRQLKERLARPQ